MNVVKFSVFAALALASNFAAARVCVYQDVGFQGPSLCWESWETGINNLNSTGLNDQISSIEITENESVLVCEDADFRGQCRNYTSNQYNLVGDFNDRISSISIRGSYQPQPQPEPQPQPQPDKDICFYTDAYFQGASFCMNRWDAPIANLVGTGFNDKISSIRIPPGVTITVFQDIGYQGAERVYSSDVYNLVGDFNDIISSIMVQGQYQPQPQPNDDICFFTDAYFQGASFCINRWSSGVENLDHTGFNDKISSIRIPPGVTLSVFQDAGYRGDERVYSGDVYNLQGDFNDIISSILVSNRGW